MLAIEDEWAAYQFDCAICTVGLAIEAAAQERENIGGDSDPKWVNKYSMKELLDPTFKLPIEDSWGLEDDELPHLDGIKYDEVR